MNVDGFLNAAFDPVVVRSEYGYVNVPSYQNSAQDEA